MVKLLSKIITVGVVAYAGTIVLESMALEMWIAKAKRHRAKIEKLSLLDRLEALSHPWWIFAPEMWQ